MVKLSKTKLENKLKMNRYYLCNIPSYKKPLVEEAILKSGRTDIHIDENPMPDTIKYYDNICVNNNFSIYTTFSEGDCSDFWKIYYDLHSSNEWQVYEKLVTSD